MSRIHPSDEVPEALHDPAIEEPFEALIRALEDGRDPAELNRLPIPPRAPSADEIPSLPPASSAARGEATARGEEMLARGEVAVLVLGGGMATRFGGAVKARVPVIGEASFLDLKFRDVERLRERLAASIPFLVLSSFATESALTQALAGHDDAGTVIQFAAPRLTRSGALFRDATGATALYATGHGDLPRSLAKRGTLASLRARGVRHLYVSNVDNLTATVEPAILGMHAASRAEVTVEVAPKHAGDRGGAPAWVDGTMQVVEGFRFPHGFDQDAIPVFNTNTLVLDLAVVARQPSLSYFAVEKLVGAQPVLQLERLIGQITAFADTRCVLVPREGADARFQPIKEVDDIAKLRGVIHDVLSARGVL